MLSYQPVEFSSQTLPPLWGSRGGLPGLPGGPLDAFSVLPLFTGETEEPSTPPRAEIGYVDTILNVANIDIELLQTCTNHHETHA